MSGLPEASDAKLRLLTLLECLCGYAITGATNKDLADTLKTSAPNVTRDMGVLIAKGWARKSDETGRFHPTSQFTRLAFRVSSDFDRAQDRLNDARRSMTGI